MKLTIQQSFEKLRNDFIEWVTNNFTAHVSKENIHTPIVEITKEEYTKLGDSVYNDGIIYYVKDADIDVDTSARGVVFDNFKTGFKAKNVQDAIDELHSDTNSKLSDLESTISTDIDELESKIHDEVDVKIENIEQELSKLVTFEWDETSQTLNIITE